MNKNGRMLCMTAGILALGCIAAPSAHAYLDAGSGSMMVQLLLAGVAGMALGLKMFWGKIVSFFGGAKRKRDDRRKKYSS